MTSELVPFRPDLQGLRFIAVAIVVLFHIWPGFLPGGYVGVDVFFVISGYLITGMLLREAQENGRISLLRFYERRVRRLVPAATVVLISITLLTPLLPEVRWRDTAIEIASSALYIENWRLAWLSVDYLGSANTASPVQHYWSLSIEEQFYLLWPLLMLGGLLSANRSGWHFRNILLGFLALIVIASFITSILVTERSPEKAYFVTHTRLWELGVGGLLAFFRTPDLSTRMREAMRLTGIIAILFASIIYSGETAFPGYSALVPTFGSALVIAAGPNSGRWTTYRILAAKPAQYMGDISYSVYLWHWPLIVFFLVFVPGDISASSGLILIAGTIVLSHLTKRHVEDRFRHGQRKPTRAIRFGLASIATCLLASGWLYASFAQQTLTNSGAVRSDFPGAKVIFENALVPEVEAPIPHLTELRGDMPSAYARKCHVPILQTEPNPCKFGNPNSEFQLVLVGDSHAANWIPALELAAENFGWSITTHTKSGCALLKQVVEAQGKPYLACEEWARAVLQLLKDAPPDLVIYTQSVKHSLASGESGRGSMVDAITEVWNELEETGAQVVVVPDTPWMPFEPGECLSHDKECFALRAKVLEMDDPLRLARARMSDIALIDMTDALCGETVCDTVIGNVIVYRDRHHLTATYSRSLATVLAERIAKLIPETENTR